MKSGAAAWSRSAAFSSSPRRALGPSADQAGSAVVAASTAASASASVAAAASVATSPLIGLRRSNVAPVEAGRGLPPIRRSVVRAKGHLPSPKPAELS